MKYILIFKVHIFDPDDSSDSCESSIERVVDCEPYELPQRIKEEKKVVEAWMEENKQPYWQVDISLTQVVTLG